MTSDGSVGPPEPATPPMPQEPATPPMPQEPPAPPATGSAPVAGQRRDRRLRLWLAGGLSLAMIAVGLGAWGTDTVPTPFGAASDDERLCWDSLPPEEASRLAGGAEEELEVEQVEEVLPTSRPETPGFCRLVVGGQQVNIQVAQLMSDTYITHTDPASIDPFDWLLEGTQSGMVPLGHPSPGMAADHGAWQTVPTECAEANTVVGPWVVEIRSAYASPQSAPSDEHDAERTANARAVTLLTNGFMDLLGCEGELSLPSDLPEQDEPQQGSADAFCGIPGFRPASDLVGPRTWVRVQPLDSPVRVCTFGGEEFSTYIGSSTLITVSDPQLASLVDHHRTPVTETLTGATGQGGFRSATGFFQAQCPSGPVLFLARHSGDTTPPRVNIDDLFLEFIETEADRLGCISPEVERAPPEEDERTDQDDHGDGARAAEEEAAADPA